MLTERRSAKLYSESVPKELALAVPSRKPKLLLRRNNLKHADRRQLGGVDAVLLAPLTQLSVAC